MQFASLGSGSSGNATLIKTADTLIMLDCGFTVKETERRMARLGVCAENLSAIVVTHEHQDHAKGVAPLSRRYDIPVFMTEGTLASRDFGRLPTLNLIQNYASFTLGAVNVTPVVVPHDAREPAQFVFENIDGVRLGVLTDLGSITPHVSKAFSRCHGLLVEANHDLEMLATGPYPPSLKARVSGHWGHLNNGQIAKFLAEYHLDLVQEIVVGHISRQNNSIECVKDALKDIIARARSIRFACQDEGFDWLTLSN